MPPLTIVSLPFLAFTGVVLLVHWLLPHRFRNAWLLAASLAFYATWGLGYLAVLIAVILWNYFLARQIARTGRRLFLWLGLGVDLLFFLSIKFLASAYGFSFLTLVTADPLDPAWTRALLPVGLSFYILQAISYLLGVSRQQIRPDIRLLDLALYLAWFPKLLAGPIERPGRFFEQAQAERSLDRGRVGLGLGLVLTGLVRKVVISHMLVQLRPVELASQPAAFSLLEKVIWLVVYGLILYNDFAGYSNIAQGVSLLFGIELPRNFHAPFFAASFADFWRRWHISLSNWLRSYVFMPVQRLLSERHVPERIIMVIAPLVTMLASGLWHGFSLGLIFWGFLHGVYMAVEQQLRVARRKPAKPSWSGVLVTYLFVTLAWVPFTASSFHTAMATYASLLSPPWLRFDWILLPGLLLLGLLSFLLDALEEHDDKEPFFMRWPRAAQAGAAAGAVLVIVLALILTPTVSGFIYQGF